MDSPDSPRDGFPRPGKRFLEGLLSVDSFGPVLLAILITYILAVNATGESERALVLFAQIGTVWLVFRVSGSRPAIRRAADILLVFAGIAAITNLLGETGDVAANALFALSCILYFIAPAAIVRHIAMKREVDIDTILGAIAAYLLIGMFFAFAYRWLGAIDSAPLYGSNGDGTMADDLFFSFTTLLTIGYGNLIPASTTGQTMAVAEGLVGSLFLIIGVAKAVASWQPAATQPKNDEPT